MNRGSGRKERDRERESELYGETGVGREQRLREGDCKEQWKWRQMQRELKG